MAARPALPPLPREEIRSTRRRRWRRPPTAPKVRGAEQRLLMRAALVKGLIEERFGALAFMEKLQRRPARA